LLNLFSILINQSLFRYSLKHSQANSFFKRRTTCLLSDGASYIIVMLIPFAITGVPHKLIDSTYYGTVKKVDIVTTTDNDSSVKPTREHLYLKNTIYLSIEQPDGKLIYKKAYSGKARLQQNINAYNEGNLVFHLYGTNTVVVLPDTNDRSVHCSVCGSSNDIENDQCRDCGHSLIKHI